MSKSKIIIAEDDTVLRDLYLRKFSSEIYDIRTASNGQEALDLMRTFYNGYTFRHDAKNVI